MKTKTTQALELFNSGNIVGALKLFKTFKIGFNPDERRIIQIAYESLTGKSEFYKSIQVDTELITAQSLQLIKSKYNTV